MPFPAGAQLLRRCPRAEGAPRRAGPPGRAATPTDTDRRRPPCPPTCSPNLRRQQALPGSHDTGNVAAVTPASGALPQAWWPNRSLRGSRQRSPGRDRLTAAAGWLPTLPRADPYPWDARAQRGPFLRPGQAGLGAGSRPGRARRPRHQSGGRELGRPPRAAAGEGALLSDSLGWDPGGPEGRSLLPGGLRNLVKLRLWGL